MVMQIFLSITLVYAYICIFYTQIPFNFEITIYHFQSILYLHVLFLLSCSSPAIALTISDDTMKLSTSLPSLVVMAAGTAGVTPTS